MCAMLYLALSACVVLGGVNAGYKVRCSNSSENGVSFEPSADGVKGRYTVMWCTEADENVTEWDLFLQFYESRKFEQCQHYDLKRPPALGKRHSHLRQNVKISSNCSNVCFTTSLDLIFKACYAIKSTLFRGSHSSESHDSFHYIRNNFTSIDALRTSIPAVKFFDYNDYVTCTWYLGSVPAVNFSMDICRHNTTLPQETCMDVTENCTGLQQQITCRLSPPRGWYTIRLVHTAPWVYGRVAVESVVSEFKHCGLAVMEVPLGSGEDGGAARWAAVCAGTALALCAAGALLHRRVRARARLRRTNDVGRETAAGDVAGNKAKAGAGSEECGARVLLLYARDCARLTEAARRLAALLQRVAPGGVYDLYSPAVSAQAAGAPGEWLRALMARDDVRVVLLQTPAAACLYATQLKQRGQSLALEQPLLGARVVPRSPHCADALLQLALRLLCEGAARGAHAPDLYPYRKYYIAEISGLEADMVPLVTPQRRYVLPAATELLLRDLTVHSAADPLPEELREFSQAVDDLLSYVRENPDYLNDELLFL